ncbi:MAG: hypothetical protein GY714_16115 [Desulfobacterales bacterium]|nr:hypothetical protein [Desulfobacterales bacterium]
MKVNILEIRPEFKRIIFIQLIKKRLEPDLKEAKDIVERILTNGKYEFDFIDLNFIEDISKIGINLQFSYWAKKELFVGTCSNKGLTKWKEQTEFSTSEIEECLNDIENLVLVEEGNQEYSIINISVKPHLFMLIESDFLEKRCVEYLLSNNVKIYKSLDEIG